MHSIRIFILFL